MQEERTEREDKPAGEGQQVRWDTAHSSYVCLDGAVVQVPRRPLVQREREASRSQVLYRIHDGRMSLQLFVLGTEFDPNMSRVVRETDGARTLALPNSAREV